MKLQLRHNHQHIKGSIDHEDSCKSVSDDDTESSHSIIDLSNSNVSAIDDTSQDNCSLSISTRLRDRSSLRRKIVFSPKITMSALNKTYPTKRCAFCSFYSNCGVSLHMSLRA